MLIMILMQHLLFKNNNLRKAHLRANNITEVILINQIKVIENVTVAAEPNKTQHHNQNLKNKVKKQNQIILLTELYHLNSLAKLKYNTRKKIN
jgi:predicted ABC-type transport system involved in lysophospholipase L1 biosynthesis ATPase subunit